jgi:choline dehydrogenase-like flavoprotein
VTSGRGGRGGSVEAIEAEVCVIGAGAGGAVVAAELAEGGARVVLLEQGPWHDPDDFSASPPQMLGKLYRDAGQMLTVGTPPVLMPLGSGLGGTTLVNSGTCFRTPEHVLERWRSEFGLELDWETLQACFARVEQALSVGEVTPELAGANAEVARRGAERLGWSHGYLRRNARGCVGSGVCVFGCPTSAKQHTGITYIPRAERAGARIVTGATVQRIDVRGGRVHGVEAWLEDRACLDVEGPRGGVVKGPRGVAEGPRGGVVKGPRRVVKGAHVVVKGAHVVVKAPCVVVAAGTVHTPLLLGNNGLGGESGQLGRNLSIHPATAAFALMDDVVDMARGVPQSLYVDEWAGEGMMLESIAGPPAYAAMALPLEGERHAEAMRSYRHLAQLGLMVSDSSRGRVRALAGRGVVGRGAMGRPLVTYDLDAADLARFRNGLRRIEELFLSAGAREVYLPLPAGVRPERARSLDLRLMGFHPLGTARADADPRRGVVDGDLRMHGVEGLYVADGSVVPSSLGVNPQITIMALATRLAYHLLERPCPA